MRVLYLEYSDSDFFALQRRACGVDARGYFDDYESTYRRIRRLPLLALEPFFSRLLSSSWSRSHANYDLIVIPASFFAPRIIRFIRRTNRDSRIVVWYWNSVKFEQPPAKFKGLQCELWSFDEEDCRRYGMRHNTQYYFALPHPEAARDVDAVFLGFDKGRVPIIRSVEQRLQSAGLRCDFHVVADRSSDPGAYPYRSGTIPYADYLMRVHRSSIIVDINADGQSGMTLRPLEALFHSKKLITNNRAVKGCDFYSPDNIFVWGHDDPGDLERFLSAPYDDRASACAARYEFGNWVARLREAA